MKKFVYMDAAASWLKNQSVIDIESDFLRDLYANAGRGICARAGRVDALIEDARETVADFIGADKKNIVWTSGTTDSFNRIVNILKNAYTADSLTFAVSDLDHHSARLPFEMWAKNSKNNLVVMPLDDKLNIDISNIPMADVYVITAMSNVIGVAQDVENIIKTIRCKNSKAITIVDAAQSVVHSKIDVKKFDCDFLCFSGHKLGSDTGVGVMYMKNPDIFMPDKFGGGMVNRIDDDKILFNKSPEKFEAGTLPITQIIGLNEAIKKFSIRDESRCITDFMYDELSKIEHIKIFTPRDSVLVSFVVDNMHVIDFGAMLGANDICVRVGNMCASWIHKELNIDGSVRISVGPWNTMDDARYVVDVIKGIVK